MGFFEQKGAKADAGWVRNTAIQDGKVPPRTVTVSQATTAAHDPPCLDSSPHRRACSGRCQMRVCAAGGGNPASPTLPAWSRACPAMCSSAAPAPSPPARCPPAASTSTPTPLAAAAPAPSLRPATASQKRNVSPGPWGWRGSLPGDGKRGRGDSQHWRSSVLVSSRVGRWVHRSFSRVPMVWHRVSHRAGDCRPGTWGVT